MFSSFGQIAFEEMRRKANDICQIYDSEDVSMTFGEVRLQAILIARHFEKLKIKQSDIIGTFRHHTSNLMALVVACYFHGSAFHSLSPSLNKQTARKLFAKTKPKIVFCDGQDIEKIKFVCTDLSSTIYTLKNHVDGTPTILELMRETGDEHEYAPAILETGSEQTISILCSSGTTGLPKTATMPNCNRALTWACHLTNDDVYFATSPIHWITAHFFLMSSIVIEYKIIISDKLLTSKYFLQVIEKYQVTVAFALPHMMLSLTKLPEISINKFDSIRYFMYGGYKCSPIIPAKMQALLKNGLTEFNAGIAFNFNFKTKADAAGELLAGVKVCIVDPKNGEKLGPKEIGEIWARHDTYWGGYFGDIKATREIYGEDGWFRTGDMGYFDDDHYLYDVDRLKDFVMHALEWFFPSEIEDIILKMPDVKDVCVFGVEHEEDCERAATAVVPIEGSSLTAQHVVDFVKQHQEIVFKQLNGGCKIYKELPKTTNMKMSRRATKALYMEGKSDKWYTFPSL